MSEPITIKARPSSVHAWKNPENPGVFLHVAQDISATEAKYFSVPLAQATPEALVSMLGGTTRIEGKGTLKGAPLLEITGRLDEETVEITDETTGVTRTEVNRTLWVEAGGIRKVTVTAAAQAFAA